MEITRPYYLGVTPVTQGAVQGGYTESIPATSGRAATVPGEVGAAENRVVPRRAGELGQRRRILQEIRQRPVWRSPRWGHRSAHGGGVGVRLPRPGGRRGCRFASDCAWTSQLAWYDWTFDDEDASEDLEDAGMRTNAVCRFPPNAFGLYDMHGNVDEWCHDWYSSTYYSRSPRRDPQGPTRGDQLVLRGGNYFDDWEMCRAAVRDFDAPDESADGRGFRIVCEWR